MDGCRGNLVGHCWSVHSTPQALQGYQCCDYDQPTGSDLLCSGDNVIIAFISLATIGALPILIPYIRAVSHVGLLYSFALLLRGALFRNVRLLLRALRPIRCAYRDRVDWLVVFGGRLHSFSSFRFHTLRVREPCHRATGESFNDAASTTPI